MNDLIVNRISYVKINQSANNRNLYHLDILAEPGIVIKISGGERDIKKLYEEIIYERLY